MTLQSLLDKIDTLRAGKKGLMDLLAQHGRWGEGVGEGGGGRQQ